MTGLYGYGRSLLEASLLLLLLLHSLLWARQHALLGRAWFSQPARTFQQSRQSLTEAHRLSRGLDPAQTGPLLRQGTFRGVRKLSRQVAISNSTQGNQVENSRCSHDNGTSLVSRMTGQNRVEPASDFRRQAPRKRIMYITAYVHTRCTQTLD